METAPYKSEAKKVAEDAEAEEERKYLAAEAAGEGGNSDEGASASSYTTYPADAPSSDFSPFPAASAAIHFLSSSAAAASVDFFASNLDGAVSKANFLAFLIASPAG